MSSDEIVTALARPAGKAAPVADAPADEDLRRQLDEAHRVMWALYKELDDKNAALERSNAELDQFATIAGHDLQEPLRKVIGFGRMLRGEYADRLDATGNDYLARMLGATERMLELIADLLRYARVTSEARPFEPVDLDAVMRTVVADLADQIRRESGEVDIAVLPTVHADSVQMRQLFQNLISNALKFHRPGVPPRVRVSAAPDPSGGVAVTVSDEGIGFKPKFAERILEPFRRLHGQGKYEGTGMGLAIVAKIVERHGGKLVAVGEVDRGSRFTVVLPARPVGADGDNGV